MGGVSGTAAGEGREMNLNLHLRSEAHFLSLLVLFLSPSKQLPGKSLEPAVLFFIQEIDS